MFYKELNHYKSNILLLLFVLSQTVAFLFLIPKAALWFCIHFQHLLFNTFGVNSFSDLYDKLAVSDRNSVKVTISTGEELELTESNFQYYLGILENQDDRRIVFEAIYKYYEEHKKDDRKGDDKNDKKEEKKENDNKKEEKKETEGKSKLE